MEQNKRIVKYAELLEMVEWLTVNELNTAVSEIVIRVPNHRILEKLNEDFYYRSDRPEGEDKVPEVGDEMNVTLNDIVFRYVVDDNQEQDADQ